MVEGLRALAAVPVPPVIRGQGQGNQSALRQYDGVPGIATWTAGNPSLPNASGAPGKGVRFSAEGGSNPAESGGVSTGAGISGAGDPGLVEAAARNAHGHAALPGPSDNDSDGNDLFGSSGSDQ